MLFLLFLGAAKLFRPPLREGLTFSQTVRDRSGKLLRLTTSKDEKYRLWIPLHRISPWLIEATLLEEDKHFRRHVGFNPVSLGRAVWSTYVKRGKRLGGSTLTMQLARVRYRIRSRSLPGKVMQLVRAVQLEWCYSKDEILEAYLNLVPYGLNIEGVGAASLIYFQKTPDKLTIAEALSLAVIPQSPTGRSPRLKGELVRFEPSLLKERQRLVEKWKEEHALESDKESELALPLTISLPSELPFLAPHFVDDILAQYPSRDEITTTLDTRVQRLLERQVNSFVEQKRHLGIENAAALLLDSRDMEIRAVVGSANFFDNKIQGQVNGTKAMRSPGSTMKPFIYALGLDQGLIHPMTMLKDTPASFGIQNPENSDRDFLGPVTAEQALNKSRNLPALNLANQLNHPNLYEFFQTAGLPLLHDADYYGLALVLGGAELTMEDLVRLYAMLANGGLYRQLKRIPMDAGAETPRALVSPEAAEVVLRMMEKNPRPGVGYSDEMARESFPVAWKTGTSNSYRDAWTVGVFGQYVLAVWVGNFEGKENQAFIGRENAAPLFFRIAEALRSEGRVEAVKVKSIPLERTRVCAVSGQMPGPHCPHKVPTWFIPGRSPIKTCEIHREILVQPWNGRRACSEVANTSLKSEVYEFWPTDLLALFRKAGIPRRTPPPYDPKCGLDRRSARGLNPEITSPVKHLSYQVRSRGEAHNHVPLEATADSDSKKLFWFIDERFLGETEVSQSLVWDAKPGRYVVRVVDDQGRSDSRGVTVALIE